jgi:hypothetical protein
MIVMSSEVEPSRDATLKLALRDSSTFARNDK